METTWVFPAMNSAEGDDAVNLTEGMSEGDFAVRRSADQLRIWRVGDQELEWLGEVPVSSLPAEATDAIEAGQVQPSDDAELRRALEGVETSLRMRGG